MKRTIAFLVPLLLTLSFASGAEAFSSGAATSSGGAKVKLSVEIWPNKGVFGYVESSGKRCESKRLVRVYRKTGGKLTPIGRDITSKTGNGFIWIIENRKATSGIVVARVAAKGRCRKDSVRKVIPLKSGDYPPCPTKEGICHLDQMKIEDDDHYFNKECPSFGSFEGYRGTCKIKVTDGRVPYCCWALGGVKWYDRRGGTRRDFEFWSADYISSGEPQKVGPDFHGWIVNDRSARFTVESAHLKPWHEQEGAEWYTPDNPDAAPGTPGGPIYLNWEAALDNHFTFYIGGFLYHR